MDMGRYKREAYLDYDEPEVVCKCGRRAALITSWTSKNPGRRFVCCVNEKNGCGFWDWYDAKLQEPKFSHYRNLMMELREEKLGLMAELKFMKKQSSRGSSSSVTSFQEQASFGSTTTNEITEEVSHDEGLGIVKLGFICMLAVIIWFVLF